MSLFQHLWSRSSCRRTHQDACCGSVNFSLPATAASTSPTEWTPWAPMIEYSQPPNQPSLIPPASGVMPFAFSLSHADSSCFHARGGLTPALLSTSFRYRTGKEGCTYQPAVQTLPL